MNLLISVWGKNGSGKSTVASNLACAFARRGYRTALVGANRFYGSIQYFFNMEIHAGQSLRAVLTGEDRLTVSDYFVECASVNGLYIASLADRDDCAGYRKMRTDTVTRFINLVKKSFDVSVFDCDESVEDPLSMYSLTFAEKIIFVTRPSVQHVVFAKAYEPIVTGLQITEQIEVLFVGGNGYDDYSQYAPFGINERYHVLPWCKTIERGQCDEGLVVLGGGADRAAVRYRRVIYALADSCADNTVAEGDFGDEAGERKIKVQKMFRHRHFAG